MNWSSRESVSCLCRNRENLKPSKMLRMRHFIKKLNSWTLTIIFAFGAHLSVTSSVRPLAGWPGPVTVVGMPVGVVVAVVAVPLLVNRAVMMVMVMVVTTVLGPATVPLALLGWQITWLCGGAEVCAQAWQRDVSVYIQTNNFIILENILTKILLKDILNSQEAFIHLINTINFPCLL